MPLDRLLVEEPPSGYTEGADRLIPEDQFVDQMAAAGSAERWHQWFDELDFVGAIERTWLPAGHSPRSTVSTPGTPPRPGGSSGDNDIVFAYLVCFATPEGAHGYASLGADDTVPGGSVSTLPETDARITVVKREDRQAVTALLRTGNAVATFTVWSEEAPPVDLLRALATEQAEHAASL